MSNINNTMKYTDDKQKFALKISRNSMIYELLAGSLDNDNYWTLVDEAEELYESNNLPNVTVKISTENSEIKHEYTVKNPEELTVEIIDIKTNALISDKIKLTDLIETMKQCSDCELVNDNGSVTSIKIDINGQILNVIETKLISFKRKNTQIKFIM